ncbi:MAG: hypothetical protein AAFR38_11895 [Planctomycetota bacterium]
MLNHQCRLLKHLRTAQAARDQSRSEAVGSAGKREVHELSNVYRELLWWTRILNSLAANESWHKTILRALQGNEYSWSDKKTLPRDHEFEHYLASKFASAGYHVECHEPDVRIHVDGSHLGVAAKRLSSAAALQKRWREAETQIRRTEESGIIALECTALFRDRAETIVSNSVAESREFMLQQLSTALDQFVPRRRHASWRCDHTKGAMLVSHVEGAFDDPSDASSPRILGFSTVAMLASLCDPRSVWKTRLRRMQARGLSPSRIT